MFPSIASDRRAALSGALAIVLGLAGLALLYAALAGLPVTGAIEPADVREARFDGSERTAFSFESALSRRMASDRSEAPRASALRLHENGRAMGPAHSLHVDIANRGEGRYSHWGGVVYFAATDNSDPRTNGRAYRYSGELRPPPAFVALAALLLAGSAWAGRRMIAAALARTTRRNLRFAPPLAPSAAILLAALSLLGLFQLLVAARRDVSHEDVFTLLAYCSAVIALQGLAVLVAGKLRGPLFALLGVANTWSLLFVFSGDVTTYPVYVQGLLLFGVASLYAVLFGILKQAESSRGWIVAAACLAAAGLGAAAVKPFVETYEPGAAVEFPGLRVVDFKRRPNVYFLGFDALTPQPLSAKLLGIPRPPYLEPIEKHGGHVLRNLFADQVPTKLFWGTTFSLVRTGDPGRIVVGMEPSLVLATFLHNGYDTQFSFANTYMGPSKGPWLTRYGVAEPYSTCTFLDRLPKRFGLLGYCALRDAGWLSPPRKPDSSGLVYGDFYLAGLREAMAARASRPQFFAAHYPYPGHTDESYRHGDKALEKFRGSYLGYAGQAARMLDRMLAEIRASDPGSITFVFGDHGAWISRGWEYDAPFAVQDRHGILGAVFGAEECLPYLRPPAGARYQTSSRVVAGLLQCLAGGVSPLAMDYDFGRIYQAPNKMRFEDHVYE